MLGMKNIFKNVVAGMLMTSALSGVPAYADTYEVSKLNDETTKGLTFQETQGGCIELRATFHLLDANIIEKQLEYQELKEGDGSLGEFRRFVNEARPQVDRWGKVQKSVLETMSDLESRAFETRNSAKNHIAPGTCDMTGMKVNDFSLYP